MRWPLSSCLSGEQGSASVLAAVLVAVMVAAMVGAAHVGAAVLARHRAQAAADLAALAGAAQVPAGAENACARAAQLGQAMASELLDCQIEGLDLVVTMQTRPRLSTRWLAAATARARAGP